MQKHTPGMFLTDFHTQKFTGGIISWVGLFLTVTLAITIGEYHKKFEISQGLRGSPRIDLENLPETPDDSRRHSGPTHRRLQKWHRKGIHIPERGHS